MKSETIQGTDPDAEIPEGVAGEVAAEEPPEVRIRLQSQVRLIFWLLTLTVLFIGNIGTLISEMVWESEPITILGGQIPYYYLTAIPGTRIALPALVGAPLLLFSAISVVGTRVALWWVRFAYFRRGDQWVQLNIVFDASGVNVASTSLLIDAFHAVDPETIPLGPDEAPCWSPGDLVYRLQFPAPQTGIFYSDETRAPEIYLVAQTPLDAFVRAATGRQRFPPGPTRWRRIGPFFEAAVVHYQGVLVTEVAGPEGVNNTRVFRVIGEGDVWATSSDDDPAVVTFPGPAGETRARSSATG